MKICKQVKKLKQLYSEYPCTHHLDFYHLNFVLSSIHPFIFYLFVFLFIYLSTHLFILVSIHLSILYLEAFQSKL